ncbi:hypothetical protein [Aquimarina sp. 2304DJ70-9]|uniref:hypothetical protein n=1 Tax=Aquimarina penaris TaxID=3231044 RepID=UPI003461D0C3
MRYITLVFTLLITFYGYTQEGTMLKGKVLVDSQQAEAIHILNQTQHIGVISDDNGFFEIKVNVGDVIVFSSIQYALKQYVVLKEDVDIDTFEIRLEVAVNELDEVRISQYSLTGDLKADIVNIPTHTKNLPFWNAAELKQMGVGGFNDAQSPVKNQVVPDEMDATPINLMGLAELAGDLFKSRKKTKEVVLEITDFYTEEFFVQGLKIPETEYYNFLDYLKEQPGTQLALRSPDKLKTLEFIIEQSQVFKSKYILD